MAPSETALFLERREKREESLCGKGQGEGREDVHMVFWSDSVQSERSE